MVPGIALGFEIFIVLNRRISSNSKEKSSKSSTWKKLSVVWTLLQVYVPLKKQPTSSVAKFLQHIMMPTWKTSSATVTPIDEGSFQTFLFQTTPYHKTTSPRFAATASARTKPAIIEIKGLRISPNTYPATIRATDSRARRIPKDYRKKAHRINSVVAPSETRPLETTNGPTRPFEKALHTFATGGPIPICVGAFGETNTSFDKLVINIRVQDILITYWS
jgi:hypothetical protein